MPPARPSRRRGARGAHPDASWWGRDSLSDTQLLILPRGSNEFKVGLEESKLRRVDVINITAATNIIGETYEGTIAPGGALNPAITTALYAPFLDINDNAQRARFGLVNGNVPGLDNLSEKWRGRVLLPTRESERTNDYSQFVANDNDFATTDGFHAGAVYNDGKDIDTILLAYRLTIGPVPQPETYALMLVGLAGVLGVSRMRKDLGVRG